MKEVQNLITGLEKFILADGTHRMVQFYYFWHFKLFPDKVYTINSTPR